MCSLVQAALNRYKHLLPRSLSDHYRALRCFSSPFPMERNPLLAFYGWDKLCVGKRTRKFWQPTTFFGRYLLRLQGRRCHLTTWWASVKRWSLSPVVKWAPTSLDDQGLFSPSVFCWAPWATWWQGWESDSPSLHQPTGPLHQEPEVTQVKHSHRCKPNPSTANHPLWQVVKTKEPQPRQRLYPHFPKFHHAKKNNKKKKADYLWEHLIKTKFGKIRVTSRCAFSLLFIQMCQSLCYDKFHTDAHGHLLIEPPLVTALSTYPQMTFGKRDSCNSQVGKRNIVKWYDLPMTAMKSVARPGS